MRGNTIFRAALAASALCGLCLTACNSDAGTSTGNPVPLPDAGRGPNDGDVGTGGLAEHGGYCNAGDKTPLALDEDSTLGFSPNDLLAFASGTKEETIQWQMPRTGLTYGPESGDRAITITVTPKGTAHHVEPAPPGSNLIDHGGAGPAIDLDSSMCTSWIEIDVEVTVESQGGAIDERFDAVLRGHTPHMASLYVSIKPEMFQGNFEAQLDSTLGELVIGGLQLGLRFSSFGVSGTFDAWFQSVSTAGGDSAGVATGGGAPLAIIGAASCIGSGFAVGLEDAVENVTAQDALDMLAEHPEIDITWETDATTTSSFAFAPATQSGCVLLDNELPGDLSIVIDGTLSMTSADGRLEGSWPGRFEAHVEGQAISRIVFRVDDKMMSNVALGGAYYGFPDIDLTTYDAAGTALDITVTPSALEGTITLIAYTYNEDCARPDPDRPADGSEPDADPAIDPSEGSGSGEGGGGSSSPGCAAAAPTELATGVLR